MTDKTITLPRSGVTLRKDVSFALWRCDLGFGMVAYLGEGPPGTWDAWFDSAPSEGTEGTMEECLAWLDAKLVDLRSSLLPSGVFVVPDPTEARDLVMEALASLEGTPPLREHDRIKARIGEQTDAILAALRKAAKERKGVSLVDELGEVHRMQLAAIACAAYANTVDGIGARLTRDNPYWTESYAMVCAAVDREVRERTRADTAEARIAGLEAVVRDCLRDYSTANFTDRYGMVDRIRALLAKGGG